MIKPLWSAKRAFALTWEYKGAALKIGLGIAVVFAIVFTIEDNTDKGGMGLTIGKMIGEAMLAFMWHRVVLLKKDEYSIFGVDKSLNKVQTAGVSEGMKSFMWTSVGFFAVLIVIFAITLLSSSVDGATGLPIMGILISLGILVFISPSIFRLALVFPAIAIGHSFNSLKAAWSSTKGHVLNIWMSYLCVSIIWTIVYTGLITTSVMLDYDSTNIFASMFFNLIGASVLVYFTMVWAGLNSTLFMQLHDDIEDYLALNSIGSVADRVNSRDKDSQ